jgi:outer membrane immunogenic protein
MPNLKGAGHSMSSRTRNAENIDRHYLTRNTDISSPRPKKMKPTACLHHFFRRYRILQEKGDFMKISLCVLGFMTVLAASLPETALARGDARVEAQIGWDQLGQGTYASKNPLGNQKTNGFAYGGNIGYDVPVSPRVSLGVDAGVGGTTSGMEAYGGSTLFKTGRDLYAGARVTLHTTSNLRVYAKVGYANTRFTSNIGYYPDAAHGGHVVRDADYIRNNDGVRAGVGVQYTLVGPVYALAEYRYTRYSEQISRNQVVTGVGLRF